MDTHNQHLTRKLYHSKSRENGFLDLYIIDYMGEYLIQHNNLQKILVYSPDDILGSAIDINKLRENLITKPGQLITSNSSDEDNPLELDPSYDFQLFHYFTSNYTEFLGFVLQWETQCYNLFASPGGDDDTFDYIPHFIWLFENLLQELGLTQYEETFRRNLFKINPEYPEFFHKHETDKWS